MGGILVLLVIAAGLVLSMFTTVIFHVVEFGRTTKLSRQGTVVGKDYELAHTDYIYVFNAATKTSMPMPMDHPERWLLAVDIGIGCDTVEVSESYYQKVEAGTSVMAEYRVGRISGRIHITGLRG